MIIDLFFFKQKFDSDSELDNSEIENAELTYFFIVTDIAAKF